MRLDFELCEEVIKKYSLKCISTNNDFSFKDISPNLTLTETTIIPSVSETRNCFTCWDHPSLNLLPGVVGYVNQIRYIHLVYSDCWFHLFCYIHNVTADASFSLLQVFRIELGSQHRISNRNLDLFGILVQYETPEEGRRMHLSKCCEYNSSPNALSDKQYQVSSQKRTQIKYIQF